MKIESPIYEIKNKKQCFQLFIDRTCTLVLSPVVCVVHWACPKNWVR